MSISDAIGVLEYLFRGKPLTCIEAADVDSDARVSLTDGIYLFDHLFRGGTSPATPYPECGLPESFAVGCLESLCRSQNAD